MSQNDKLISDSGLRRALQNIKTWVTAITKPITFKYRNKSNKLVEEVIDGTSEKTIDMSDGVYYATTSTTATRVSNELTINNNGEVTKWDGSQKAVIDISMSEGSPKQLFLSGNTNDNTFIATINNSSDVDDFIEVIPSAKASPSTLTYNSMCDIRFATNSTNMTYYVATRRGAYGNGEVEGSTHVYNGVPNTGAAAYLSTTKYFVYDCVLYAKFDGKYKHTGDGYRGTYLKYLITEASCKTKTAATGTGVERTFCPVISTTRKIFNDTVNYEAYHLKAGDYIFLLEANVTSLIVGSTGLQEVDILTGYTKSLTFNDLLHQKIYVPVTVTGTSYSDLSTKYFECCKLNTNGLLDSFVSYYVTPAQHARVANIKLLKPVDTIIDRTDFSGEPDIDHRYDGCSHIITLPDPNTYTGRTIDLYIYGRIGGLGTWLEINSDLDENEEPMGGEFISIGPYKNHSSIPDEVEENCHMWDEAGIRYIIWDAEEVAAQSRAMKIHKLIAAPQCWYVLEV